MPHQGIDINIQNSGKETPLHSAVRSTDPSVVDLLVFSGAKVHVQVLFPLPLFILFLIIPLFLTFFLTRENLVNRMRLPFLLESSKLGVI